MNKFEMIEKLEKMGYKVTSTICRCPTPIQDEFIPYHCRSCSLPIIPMKIKK